MRTGLFAGFRKAGSGGATTYGKPSEGSESSLPVDEKKNDLKTTTNDEVMMTTNAPSPSAHVVSPVVANLFRRAAANVANPPLVMKGNVRNSSGLPETKNETQESKTFFKAKRESANTPVVVPEESNDDVFHRRLAIQRASNNWSPLIVAWFQVSEISRGTWSLPALMEAIRSEAKDMARLWSETSGMDERIILSFTGMLAKALASELKTASRDGRVLGEDAVKEAGAALRGILDEPPSMTSWEPVPNAVHVKGKTSRAISTADIASKLLPLIGRHAGLASREILEIVLDEIRHRSHALVSRILPDAATEKDRQSLSQSIMRREAELMASCLEDLPPAGMVSFGQGWEPLYRALERYRNLSAILAQEVERIANVEYVQKTVNLNEVSPIPG